MMTRRIRLRRFVGGWIRITGSRGGNGETGVVRRGAGPTGACASSVHAGTRARSHLNDWCTKNACNARRIKAFVEI